jgi:hypothetical protein
MPESTTATSRRDERLPRPPHPGGWGSASIEIRTRTAQPRHARGSSYVDLYWLPLGAGGHSVRFNGLAYEAVAARLSRRERCDLYHSALEVREGPDRYVIEMAPVCNERAADRGVVSEGAVGSRRLGRFRAFRYEIRRWRDGRIPDVAVAVDSPQRLSEDPAVARRLLDLVPSVPTPMWGRDEAHSGDMWNSNSVTAWLLIHAGINAELVDFPAGGRAPGRTAGLAGTRPASVSARAAEGAAVSAVHPTPAGATARHVTDTPPTCP